MLSYDHHVSPKDLKDDFHSDTVLSILNEQRIRGVLCDVTIIVEDTKFKAHSNVLAASSLYFKNIFWSRAICISGHVLELDDLKADVFTEILNYIYSSTVIVKRQETVLDLAAAGKKLGISFLEDLTDKSISNSPCLYSFCNTEKGEVKEEKRQEDSAITNGPRITNAYSIHENENCNNLFSPLDLRASFKKMPEKSKVSNISQERHNAGKGVERVSTLAEHSYAVSMGCEAFQKKSFYHESSPLDRMDEDGSETGQSMPVTNSVPQIFNTSKAVLNSQITEIPSIQLLTINGTNAVGHQQVVNNHTISFQKSHPNNGTVLPSKNDENNSDHISGSIVALIPHVYNCTKSFSDGTQFTAHLQLHSQAQEAFICKCCSKQFETVTELETHEQGCGGLDNCENEQNCLDNFVISNGQTVTSYINPESTITENELADYSVTNCAMPETDHFVKVVDGQVLYTCSVCKRAYVTLSSLRRHSNVHSWRRTYPCHYCNKVFALAEYRTRHEIWHTGERRYQCIFCLETFMTYYILKNHQKSFHAIDHRLGVNKKTANGGLKPGAYPYKLYRLLPMKCKRPPYKSYGSTSYESIQTSIQVTEDTSSTCIIQNAVTSEVPPLNFPHSILPNSTVPMDTSSCSDATAAPVNTPIIISPWEASVSEAELKTDTCTIEIPLSSTPLNSGPQDYDSSLQNVSNGNASENSASVINYNNSPPTVIMHSGRISSVIMHSNAVNTVSSTETADITTSQAANDDDVHDSEDSKSNIRTRSNKEKKEASLYNEEETSDDLQYMANATMSSDISTDPVESSDKTETYIAKPALPGTSADSNVAPLCQITVKIGNEAIVKRHILGSKLFYRKDRRSKPESKEDHTAQIAERDKRERSTSRVCRSDYIELNEMCDDVSDHDSNDKPWRPYYNYKPKKKSKQLRKIRKSRWRGKHRSRNSYRESEKTHVTSYALRNIPEEKVLQQEEEKNMPSLPCELCEKDTTSAENAPDNLHWDTTTFESYTCELCRKSFQSPSALRMHMRCHTGEKPYTCKTCGKNFSISGNLHKHERTHLGVKDFICQYCNKAFSLNETLKIHERIHTGEKRYQCQFCFQGFLYLSTKRNHERRHKRENNGKGHACFQCPKVCKTAAALGMHQKKHLFKNPKQEDGDDYLFHESTKPFVSQPFIDPDSLETAKPLLNVGADGHETSST